ncbi:hypothetical protein CcaverHIS631_0307070 [Cutaneotrichosporon cavernicola]|nr:hypothetical protein CcaverHIS631_0307070 [Cutaneotrichosporon cavernicola]
MSGQHPPRTPSTPHTPGTPPIEVTVESLALHKLRTLLHRGSRLSLRIESQPQSRQSRQPTPETPEPKAHAEPPSPAHKADSGSASITPLNGSVSLSENPTEAMKLLSQDVVAPIVTPAPAPPTAPAPVPVTSAPAALNLAANLHAAATPPTAAPVPPTLPVSTSPRPPLTVDTGASPEASAFHTPHTSVPPSPETHFATTLENSAITETRDARLGSDPFAIARRRGSAVSAISACSVGSPHRMPPVLHAPPMPMPIAHLPSLNTGSMSPGWGTLALQSPALSRTNSRASGSFPFPTPVAQSRNNSKDLTDAEVRRATKSMPVILRVPSRQPQEPEEEEDDEDDEGESADGHVGATPRAHPASPPHSAYIHKGLGHLAMDPVTEESRSGTPQPGSRTASSVGLAALQREQSSPSVSDDTPSSLGVASVPWPSANAPEADEVGDDSSVEESFDSVSIDDNASGSLAQTSIATPSPTTPSPGSRRPSLYSQLSQSMMNLSTPRTQLTAAPAVDSPDELETVHEVQATAPDLDHDYVRPPPLKRRLSAGDADPAPPMYESVHLNHNAPVVDPREEEGHERLPPYWCGVHIEGTLSRKMEFIQPGVQARDRAWKKHYFVLHGTALFVYKFDPTKVPLRMGEPYLTADENESYCYLHVHLAPDHHRASLPSQNPVQAIKQARRATVGQEAAPRINAFATALSNARRGTVGSRTPTRYDQGPESKDRTLFEPPRRQSGGADSVASSTASAPIASHMPFAHNVLVHVYSMQGAESGLAADYKKRLHCVRLRVQGQQFMLQTDTARQCVQWIEAFQAAANVALDLDTRPMPIQQTLPRRRRRRRPQPEVDPNAVPTSDNANAAFADSPEGNLAAVVAAEHAEHERDRMVAEDQAAAGGRSAV